MSEVIFHEEISADVAEPLIGTDNLKAGASYYMITSVEKTVIMRKAADGDETEFELQEPEFKGYSDGIDFAKFEPTVDRTPVSHIGLYILMILVFAFIGGIAAIAYLLINF